jgi:hypothetical protein
MSLLCFEEFIYQVFNVCPMLVLDNIGNVPKSCYMHFEASVFCINFRFLVPAYIFFHLFLCHNSFHDFSRNSIICFL